MTLEQRDESLAAIRPDFSLDPSGTGNESYFYNIWAIELRSYILIYFGHPRLECFFVFGGFWVKFLVGCMFFEALFFVFICLRILFFCSWATVTFLSSI